MNIMKNNTKVNNNTNNNTNKGYQNPKNIVSGKTYVRPLHKHNNNICSESLSFCSCVKHKK